MHMCITSSGNASVIFVIERNNNNNIVPIFFVLQPKHICFTWSGNSSVMGTREGLPYTVAEDENTIFLQLLADNK